MERKYCRQVPRTKRRSKSDLILPPRCFCRHLFLRIELVARPTVVYVLEAPINIPFILTSTPQERLRIEMLIRPMVSRLAILEERERIIKKTYIYLNGTPEKEGYVRALRALTKS